MEELLLLLHTPLPCSISENFDLQRFASAEDEGRTELPTESKKRKAREEGNVPMSPELTGLIIFLSVFFTIALFWRYFYEKLLGLVRYYIENIDVIPLSQNNVQGGFWGITAHLTSILGPILGIAVTSTLVVSLAQTRFLFTTKKLTPDFTKVFGNIFKNLKKMFWSRQAMFNLGKSLLKVFAVFGIAAIFILNDLPSIIAYVRMEVNTSFGMSALMLLKFMIFSGFLLLIFATADYIFQYKEHIESLKMTKKEFMDELKDQEGDPMIKAKIRQMESQIGMRRMMAAVPEADVVITNPTHYAVAIKYSRFLGSAPIVVAKGADRTALRIREIATENRVLIHENKPLARGLYDTVPVGAEIPYEYWEAVALVLNLVYTARGENPAEIVQNAEYI